MKLKMEEPELDMQSSKEKKLGYSIHSCSSYSNGFRPQHIQDDRPKEQSSRWSSGSNIPPQWILLKLERPAIVTAITFGKFEKPHVCNPKRLKIFVGMDENSFMEVLDTNLKNDSTEETFHVKHTLNKAYLPSTLIKIQPIQSWGNNFNYSIWYIELKGDDNHRIVSHSIQLMNEDRERETIRLCLKHFREHNYLEAFESLEKRTRVQLEDTVITQLHTTLVKDGDYDGVERIVGNCISDGIMDGYVSHQQPKPVWEPLIFPEEQDVTPTTGLTPTSSSIPLTSDDSDGFLESNTGNDQTSGLQAISGSGVEDAPSIPPARGGHQLVMDSSGGGIIYLFGGWDGRQDLADFWAYDIPTNKWTLISGNTEKDGGPPARSCHKMLLNPGYKQLFVLGRYVDRSKRDQADSIKSDFYLYDISTSKWTLISDDTSEIGGPSLVFDHQMCLDAEQQNIYVFGGQSVQGLNTSSNSGRSEKVFSGLFVYNIPNNTWTCLWEDGQVISKGPQMKSRSSHAMVFSSVDRNLYIIGGQRGEYLNDFFAINVDTLTVNFLTDRINQSVATAHALGYTQRATIDTKNGEIFVMMGVNNKDKSSTENVQVSNSFWIYSIKRRQWSCFYRNERTSSAYWNLRQSIEPRPRYAHQLVFDEERETHYMFGGNPGGNEAKVGKLRLGDFWRITLDRPMVQNLARFTKVLIRSARFKELCGNPREALLYLQQSLTPCVDMNNEEERINFQQLPAKVFEQSEDLDVFNIRTKLFTTLLDFFPDEMTQPTSNLVDMIPLRDREMKGEVASLRPDNFS